MTLLKIEHLSKSFANTLALAEVSLTLDEGQILCLLGPSGCGKTTLLRLIAGLDTPDSGDIFFEDRDVSAIAPHQRGFGLMFQEFALFPHKNVGQNVAFGLQHLKRTEEIEARVREMLALVGLAGFEPRDVNSLSGGERQRVALARSLAPGPRLLMLDEPLGALDRALRERLMLEIRQILKQLGLTAIYVTHDQTEAFAVADRVIVMNRGRIEQDEPPEQVYYQPATPFVAQFLGFTNLLPGVCRANGHVETTLGVWSIPAAGQYPTGTSVTVLIRPEAASLEPVSEIVIEGELIASLFRGRFYQYNLEMAGQSLIFEIPPTPLPSFGSKIALWLDPAAITLFATDKKE
ncbi:MAG: ABC transporter ATP-binding protein [Chloroflexi bacterium]|nr:ABC transporter ATP-binding protein [Chloroflexota bacterium]